jgi:hypothetical protein
MVTILGACSLCGGRVTCPTVFHSVVPPTPTCESCGAVAAQHGPVIEMAPSPWSKTSWSKTTLTDRQAALAKSPPSRTSAICGLRAGMSLLGATRKAPE